VIKQIESAYQNNEVTFSNNQVLLEQSTIIKYNHNFSNALENSSKGEKVVEGKKDNSFQTISQVLLKNRKLTFKYTFYIILKL
jgi:hypothetical protein